MFEIRRDKLISDSHDYGEDRALATLFTTGNGYMGVRGSYEEYSELGIQGAYLRGFLDEVVEICVPVIDSEHLKREYFNEEALKDFERQECGINAADILTMRVSVGGKTFFMHEGILKSFRRELDFSTGVLTRDLVWEDGEGNETRLLFERFASFADDHLYCQRLTVLPLNHRREIQVLAGLDLRTKTQGQRVTKVIRSSAEGDRVRASVLSGPKYGFRADFDVKVSMRTEKTLPLTGVSEDILACRGTAGEGVPIVVEKIVRITTSRDHDKSESGGCDGRSAGGNCEQRPESGGFLHDKSESGDFPGYEQALAAHLDAYRPLFSLCDVRIEGDDRVDGELRFCSYHTLISACRRDSVHGVSAKGLTGERYCQYVWWDSEIYQMPFFLATRPETARQLLLYRFGTLEGARKIAAAKGLKGARFPFCSGASGEECVWSYVRHPFLQDHISADVAFAVLNYHRATGDDTFIERYGLELAVSCCEYWLSRAEKAARGWEIRHVTGPDEHHADVDNDAYTNYLVRRVCLGTAGLLRKFPETAVRLNRENLAERLEAFAGALVLPERDGPSGIISQFDGYFQKSPSMESGAGQRGLQMKYAGSYASSQIIKQPDVLMLFTYADAGMDRSHYAENLDFYEHRCECSSSLSYAPHAIASAHNRRMASFYEYLRATIEMDLANRHGGVEEGIHAGCAAGGYLSILYGLFGVRYGEDALIVDPRPLPWWKSVTLHTTYRNVLLKFGLYDKICVITNESKRPVRLEIHGEIREILGTLEIPLG